MRSGALENARSPSTAVLTSVRRVNLASPLCRTGRSYSTPVWRNPAQLRRPRMKRFFSGRRRTTSTTRRSIRPKSPASRGISTSETSRMSTVEPVVAGPLPEALLALPADGVDDFEAGLPLGDEVGEHFRRVLEVGVHDDDRLAAGVVHPRRHRPFLAEVPGQPDQLDAVVVALQLQHGLGRTVAAAVVDEEDLVRSELVEHRRETVVEDGDVPLLVVEGDDDRDSRGLRRGRFGKRTVARDLKLAQVRGAEEVDEGVVGETEPPRWLLEAAGCPARTPEGPGWPGDRRGPSRFPARRPGKGMSDVRFTHLRSTRSVSRLKARDPEMEERSVPFEPVQSEDPWERHAGWWQEGSPTVPTRSTRSRSCPLFRRSGRRGRPGPRRGTGEGQLARAGRPARRARSSASTRPGRSSPWPGSGPAGRSTPGGRRPACPVRSGAFDAVVACLVFEHIVDYAEAIAEVARVLRPGGRFLFFLNHPLLQTPNSGWIDDHILEEQYWRIGPYLVEDISEEEVAPGVRLPFIHRPLSRYVNAMAERPADRADGGAGPAARVPRAGGRVPRGGQHPPAALPAGPQDPLTAGGDGEPVGHTGPYRPRLKLTRRAAEG